MKKQKLQLKRSLTLEMCDITDNWPEETKGWKPHDFEYALRICIESLNENWEEHMACAIDTINCDTQSKLPRPIDGTRFADKTPIVKLKRMSDEKWFKKFKPIKNHLCNDASWDGYMFETYGEELQFVLDRANGLTGSAYTVWTWIDGDTKSLICEGYHLVNRIGYLITEVPYDPALNYEITNDFE